MAANGHGSGGAAAGRVVGAGRRADHVGAAAGPAAPRSAMFFPLVVLVAVLPGLYALN